MYLSLISKFPIIWDDRFECISVNVNYKIYMDKFCGQKGIYTSNLGTWNWANLKEKEAIDYPMDADTIIIEGKDAQENAMFYLTKNVFDQPNSPRNWAEYLFDPLDGNHLIVEHLHKFHAKTCIFLEKTSSFFTFEISICEQLSCHIGIGSKFLR